MMQDFLSKLTGRPYKDFDDDGNYIGCFEPFYLVYDGLPKIPLPQGKEQYFFVGLQKIFDNFEKVESPKPFDMIVFRFRGDILHVGLFLGGRKFLHVQRGSAFEICRLAPYENKVFGYFTPKKHIARKLL